MKDQYPLTARCELAHATVSTAQTQAECASTHDCPPRRICPLGALFANVHATNRALNASNDASPFAGTHRNASGHKRQAR